MTFILIPAISKWVSLPTATIGLGVATAYSGLQINLLNKTRREYVWLLGLRFGRVESYSTIEYLFLKANHVRQNMSARLATTTLRFQVYDGFIRFSASDKFHLFRGRDQEVVMNKLKALAEKLDVDVQDYTGR